MNLKCHHHHPPPPHHHHQSLSLLSAQYGWLVAVEYTNCISAKR